MFVRTKNIHIKEEENKVIVLRASIQEALKAEFRKNNSIKAQPFCEDKIKCEFLL